MSTPKELEAKRHELDLLDTQLLDLLRQRIEAVRAIAQSKAAGDLPIRDEGRERKLFDRWAELAEQRELSPYFVSRILRELLNYSRRYQEGFVAPEGRGPEAAVIRVAYQGIAGSYSHQAVLKLFPGKTAGQLESKGFSTFRAAVDALERGETDFALLPIENSIAGSINETYDLLLHRQVPIVAEERLEIAHCLLGVPGATIHGLRVIRSHPVALLQCGRFLGSLPGAVAESCEDTAAAAEEVARKGDASVGAIANEGAARMYGLEILRRDVADQPENVTRFVLVARNDLAVDRRGPCKTSLVLRTNHEEGALVKCLQALHSHGINMTKLESRPVVRSPGEYRFFIDIDGHVDDPKVAAALQEMRERANYLRILGSYRARQRDSEEVVLSTVVPPAGASAKGSTPAPPPSASSKYKLAARRPEQTTTPVRVGDVTIGGTAFVIIGGPCAIESREQIMAAAALTRHAGCRILRGGAFKPRTSPYSFQGLGLDGVDLMLEAGRAYEMPIVTEVLRPEDVPAVAEKAHMFQIGARNMQNYPLLQAVGRTNVPVLLKRGMSASIEELLYAAEYILAAGNGQVVLCERGIRTFETATRNTLDISAVPVLKARTHLPVVVDPSHAAGVRWLVAPLARAAAAVGADGLIVEAHPDPDASVSDAEQALSGEQLAALVASVRPVLESVGRTL
jgi:3-deoxy-7-phosphoheptulonate synthase